jgi:hypothetical protein
MSEPKAKKTRKTAAPAEAGPPVSPAPPLRVTTFTQEVADLICEALAEGHSLRSICASDDMPSKSTVFKWLREQPAFSDQYAHAREAQADCLFDDILEIADDGRNDKYIDDEGQARTDHDVIARSKLRVDARKWMAAKLRPRVYGDKLAIGGADDLPPIKAMTDEQLEAAIAKAAAAANGSDQ